MVYRAERRGVIDLTVDLTREIDKGQANAFHFTITSPLGYWIAGAELVGEGEQDHLPHLS
ncbi:TPA: hypothetical protein EYP44_04275 [Candidatus Bathyarchaeota archaeon]|nr:hypothetical protein [Candidatus Bathyarchaeota archaeon]